MLDADIRGFFDAIDHEWLLKFVEHRVVDQRVLRHIKKWLNAGVLEDGKLRYQECGTPQGGSISPLLANIYLHYVLDLWVDRWRRTQTDKSVIVVRYADDFIVGFQIRADGERFLLPRLSPQRDGVWRVPAPARRSRCKQPRRLGDDYGPGAAQK